MTQTIVGVYDNASTAQQAAQAVIAAGIDRSRVRLSTQEAATTTTASTAGESKGFWAEMKEAFGFGDDNDDQYGYREAARRGGTVVAVDADENQTNTVCTILERYGPADLDQKAEQWKSEGWAGYDKYKTAFASGAGTGMAQASTSGGATARVESTVTQARQAAPQPTAATGRQAVAANQQEAIPVVEEKLNVGKQVVTRGGIRIHSRVTERPVEAQVNLREEHVKVERRPVDRPLTGAEATAAFQEQTITATERAEQAVVSKQARVVEEVEVGKQATERTETVRDTVRKSDVEVERIDASDARFRPAYEFADELAANEQYRGRTFDTFESDARRSFEQRNPHSKWDEVKDAIRSRYDRARSKT